ncbi:MAG TPA: glycosyltransferase [Polyangiaceae bacterium]|jgi:GT2 family glycosyltransferase|nr:glycosyltransferase [Polyangiaceae bacterium]
MMAALRCNVELSLVLEGVGVLVAGWAFESRAAVYDVALLVESEPPIEIGESWVRVSRPDVVELFSVSASDEVLARNRDSGFFALAAHGGVIDPRSRTRLLFTPMDRGPSVEAALSLEPSTGPLEPNVANYLRHNLPALLRLFKMHDVVARPSVQSLLAAVGSEPRELDRMMGFDPSANAVELGIDLAAANLDEGLVMIGWVSLEAERVSAARLGNGGAENIDVLPFTSFLSSHAVAGRPASSTSFVIGVPPAALAIVPRRLTLRFELTDGTSVSTSFSAVFGGRVLVETASSIEGEAWLALAEVIEEHWTERRAWGEESIRKSVSSVAKQARGKASAMFEAVSKSVAGAIDYVFVIPNRGLLVVGWMIDFEERVRSLVAHWSGGRSGDVLPEAFRLSRPDLVKAYAPWSEGWSSDRVGFACFAPAPGVRSDVLESSLYFTFQCESKVRWRLRPLQLRTTNGDPTPCIREILKLIPPEDANVLFKHLGPAIDGLWASRSPRREQEPVFEIGAPPERPTVSVVVPIYGRYDLIEYQLALFADDPDFQGAELIYVVDDPRIAQLALRLCRELFPLYRVPCRVVVCRRNNGFAAANNVGAAIARGRLLLLLNSDVMPIRSGWLSELTRIYDALRQPGALGATLLFPDGSVQHAGMTFGQIPTYPGLWLNSHPKKGHPNEPNTRKGPVAVPAVTAACLMVERQLYLSVGGLDEDYILGDFEDSDFCLKLRAAGRQVWYSPAVELYHLERQSQTLIGTQDWRHGLTLYNAWRQTEKWGGAIGKLLQEGSSWKSDTAS